VGFGLKKDVIAQKRDAAAGVACVEG
jgi:hypothetical protein